MNLKTHSATSPPNEEVFVIKNLPIDEPNILQAAVARNLQVASIRSMQRTLNRQKSLPLARRLSASPIHHHMFARLPRSDQCLCSIGHGDRKCFRTRGDRKCGQINEEVPPEAECPAALPNTRRDRHHGCPMARASFLDRMCLETLAPSGF